jgi:hypothetical protein
MLEEHQAKIPWNVDWEGNLAHQVPKFWGGGTIAQRIKVEHHTSQWNMWENFARENTRVGGVDSTCKCQNQRNNSTKGSKG